jgi:hypothetical protein
MAGTVLHRWLPVRRRYVPHQGEVCLHNDILVYIHSGCDIDPVYGRVSNYWWWSEVQADGSLGPKKEGYGGKFTKLETDYNLVIRVEMVGRGERQ